MKQLFYLHLGMNYSYLALGDSYTIGEQVMITESFPYQLVQLLRKNKLDVYAPEIIAKTGWTTDELSAAIEQTSFLPKYDIVSLLIGVNNQYRGRSVNEFKVEFDHLIQVAIKFAANIPEHVYIVSIPDWGITPFAEGRDRKKIAEEIDAYNNVCKTMSAQYKTNFTDITTDQRKDNNTEYIAADGLHPSGTEYAKWAAQLAKKIMKQ